MATDMKIPLRDARDRVIDLLRDARTFRLGKTYPLQDLPVRDEQLKVAFGSVARIPIENSQPGVTYQLFDPHKKAVGDRIEGDGGTLLLPTPEIQEDITYRILATKIATGLQ